MAATEPTRQEQRSGETRSALLAAARELFTERGYANVGTEEIVKRAKVTRGALYHHFEDKKDLFRAVHEANEERLVAGIAAKVEGITDPMELLATGVSSFLDACEDPAISRIGLIDAPAVLGWKEWREIDAKYGLGLVTAVIQANIDAGLIEPGAGARRSGTCCWPRWARRGSWWSRPRTRRPCARRPSSRCWRWSTASSREHRRRHLRPRRRARGLRVRLGRRPA